MVVHIKYNKGNNTGGTTKIVEKIVEKQADTKVLMQTAKEMAKVMAKEMAGELAKEMAKEIVANMPAQQIVEIRREGSDTIEGKNDLVALDESIVDVTSEGNFEKNFDSLGQTKISQDSGQDKRDKLRRLKKKS